MKINLENFGKVIPKSFNYPVKRNIFFKSENIDSVEISEENKKLNKEFLKLKKRLDEKIKRCKTNIQDEETYLICSSNYITLSTIASLNKKRDLEAKLRKLENLKSELTIEKTKFYLEKKKQNSNTAFLYNPINTYQDKKLKISKHPEIKPLANIINDLDENIKKLTMEDFFIIDEFETESSNPKYRIAKVVDMSLLKNQQVYAMLSQLSQNKENSEEFYKNYVSKSILA